MGAPHIVDANGYHIATAQLADYGKIEQRSTWSKHANSRIFYLVDDLWTEPYVVDVSAELQADVAALSCIDCANAAASSLILMPLDVR